MSEKGPTVYVAPPPPPFSGDRAAEPAVLKLTEAQQKQYDEVLAHFSKEGYLLSGSKDGGGALHDEEKFWLSKECMLRFLRATKWAGSQTAIKRLEGTLVWRRDFGIYDVITADHIEPESTTGKIVLWGYDTDRRPAVYLLPSRQNTEVSHRQVEQLVFFLERLVDLMGPGVENLALMVDYADKAKNPPLSQSREVLSILQTHYPERLGRALITNLPWVLNAFFKLITPFIDPVTRLKMRFNPKCVDDGLFTRPQLFAEWGGSVVFEHDHEKYWPALNRMCAERRAAMFNAWRVLGGTVGVREWDVARAAEDELRAPSEPGVTAAVEDGSSAVQADVGVAA